MKAYEELIPQNEMPNYFINFDVAPDTIDVNIHPTKTEIKFENEQAMWPIVLAAVKEALGKFCAAPSIDFDMDDAPDIPAYTPGSHITPPSKGFNPSYNPFNTSSRCSNNKRPEYDWQKLYEGFTTTKNDIPTADDNNVADAAYEMEGPVYLRFGRLAIPVFHDEDYKFEIGKGEILKDGTDVAIIANGLLTYEAIKAGEELAAAGINAMVINMATIKPLDEELVIAAAKKCGKIITCEEHSVIGGLGEAVASVLSEKCPTILRRIGVNDEFGHSGAAVKLLEDFGLCASNIVKVAKEFCGK